MPQVELLWWEKCPSWERALAMVREAMTDQGLDPDSVVVREIDTEDAARSERFVGSPTIRVDGAEVQPPGEDEAFGLTCRVYRHRDGRISPLPDPDEIRDALAGAARAAKS
jgi:hypothetical protein